MSKLSVLELAGTASLLQVQDRGETVRAGASEGLTEFQAASPDQAGKTPLTDALRGAVKLPADFDERADLTEELQKKHGSRG